jgi:hypothetical protein
MLRTFVDVAWPWRNVSCCLSVRRACPRAINCLPLLASYLLGVLGWSLVHVCVCTHIFALVRAIVTPCQSRARSHGDIAEGELAKAVEAREVAIKSAADREM